MIEHVYMLTPNHWNAHLDLYENNEAIRLDWEGNREPRDWESQAVIIDEIDGELDEMANVVSAIKAMTINKVIESRYQDECHSWGKEQQQETIPRECDEIDKTLYDILCLD